MKPFRLEDFKPVWNMKEVRRLFSGFYGRKFTEHNNRKARRYLRWTGNCVSYRSRPMLLRNFKWRQRNRKNLQVLKGHIDEPLESLGE